VERSAKRASVAEKRATLPCIARGRKNRVAGRKRIGHKRAMSSLINRTMNAREWVLLCTLAAVWGATFFFAKIALAELPPLTLVLCRVAIAALILLMVVRASGLALPSAPRVLGAFLVLGAINNVIPFGLIFWGQTRIDSGLASILNGTTPLWAVLLAHVVTRDEKLTPARIAGVLLGFAGLAVMIGPDALRTLGGATLAQLAVVAGTFSYACAGLFGRHLRDLPPVVTAAGQLCGSTLLMTPIAAVADRPWTLPMPGAATWAAVLGLATVSTAFAYFLYFRILATAGATNLMLVTFLIPVSALALGIFILGEALTWRQVAGMALIGLGLAAIDGRVFRARSAR
jgi:drug/metabolite transporter (DMT)-like permease